MERQLYHEIAVSDGALQTAERQRRRRALTAAWLIVGGLYASIVACSVLVQSRASGSVAELHRANVTALR